MLVSILGPKIDGTMIVLMERAKNLNIRERKEMEIGS